jgi:hypothetical protein
MAFIISLILVLLSSYWFSAFTASSIPSIAPAEVAKPIPAIAPTQQFAKPTDIDAVPSLAPTIAPTQQLAKTDEDEEKLKPFDETVKGFERLTGLFTLYRNSSKGKLYLEVQPSQLEVNYLCTITMESGIGTNGIYSGMPIADFPFAFKRVNKRLQFVIPNVYFRTNPNDPLGRSVKRGFSDSVLHALTIKSIHPQRKSLLIDLEPLLLKDFPGLVPFLNVVLDSPYSLDDSKSYFGTAKTFPKNVELESIYSFNGSGGKEFPAFVSTLPDSRTFSLNIRYSFSQLPVNNGYRPRLADDRIGYFITAYQNFSDDSPRTPFVRYINRWHLEKQDLQAPLSPPKQPIVFWIENTVPKEYQEAVREGVLMWNQAFEQAGFREAIVVKQMPDKADWDPADVRYNTIRWLTSFDGGFLGIGPSRTNPLTGEILDADILIDASFSRYLKQRYQSQVQQNQMRLLPALAKMTGNPDLCSYGIASHYLHETTAPKKSVNPRLALQMLGNYDLCYGLEASHQLAVGSMALSMLHNALPNGNEMKQYIQDFLRVLVAHEVGHTLGLRHNFRASAALSPADLNNPEVTRQKGLTASVMDYAAVNLAPQGVQQGDFFSRTIGAYDKWAIAYGYTPSNIRVPQAESRFLEKIARRAPEPDLAYATDEDRFARLDPQTNAFDLSSDLLTYAPWQLENARQMWQRIDRRFPGTGESFSDVRQMFDEVFDYYFQYARFLTVYIGGQSFNRYRGGDAKDKLPFEAVTLTQQRQAMSLIQKYVFDEKIFQFSPQFLNKLAPTRWNHWGEDPVIAPLDYPIHDRILRLQSVILNQLLAPDRLARLRDAELKTPPEQAFTIPELFETLQGSIWREVIDPADKIQLSSLRRGLQREYTDRLVRIVLRTTAVPEDARTVAWYQLKQLRSALDNTIKRKGRAMDVYTRAHFEESRDRINKALDAQLRSQ